MATTSGTSPEHVDNEVNTNNNDDKKKKEHEEEAKKLQSTPTVKIKENQGDKTTEKSDDSMKIGKTDTLSSVKSTNEDKKSDQTSPKLYETSDTNTEKQNEEKTVETTTTIDHQNKESSSAPVADNKIETKETTTTVVTSGPDESTSTVTSFSTKNDEDSKKDQTDAFPIEKGDSQHLTDFQRQKAKYFFNVNLDIENKEYVTWEDVEFYLLFHANASGKEGSDGGDLEARLSRATRAIWEHIHDQLPLSDKKRDQLTLDQVLDTWASLIEYVVRTGRLPPMVQKLVKLGFELYSTDNGDGKSTSIGASAFDQLFQKMNLGRPYAIMVYKYLTENGTKPLDAETIESIVKAVITSSDDEHDSHFLLPGFFITIAENKNKNKTSPSASDNEQSNASDKPTPTSSSAPSPPTVMEKPNVPPPQMQQSSDSSSSQTQQQNGPSASSIQPKQPSSTPASSQAQQTNGAASYPKQPVSSQTQPTNDTASQSKQPASPQIQRTNGAPAAFSRPQKSDGPLPSQKQSGPAAQNSVIESPSAGPSTNQQQSVQLHPKSQTTTIQQEDENIRSLLRFYRIDDGDVVEVSGGSVQRLVRVHPERPLPPPHIKQNNQKQQPAPTNVSSSSVHQNGSNGKPSTETPKPKVTLEERISRGEAQKGATVPLRQESKQESSGARQVYPSLSETQQEEQRKQAKLQANPPPILSSTSTEEKTTVDSKTKEASSVSEKDRPKDLTNNEEDKIVAAVLKKLAPMIEKRVADEVRRAHTDEDDDDDDDFNPFPFMFGGGGGGGGAFPFFAAPHGGLPPQAFQQQGVSDPGHEQQANDPRVAEFQGLSGGGGAFIPPQLLMAMMNDLARGGGGGGIHGFPPNMGPPPRGPGGVPVGVEGFMMFVDDDQMMGSPSGFPPRSGPRF